MTKKKKEIGQDQDDDNDANAADLGIQIVYLGSKIHILILNNL